MKFDPLKILVSYCPFLSPARPYFSFALIVNLYLNLTLAIP